MDKLGNSKISLAHNPEASQDKMVSIDSHIFDRSIIFFDRGVSHYRGLDDRVLIKKGTVIFEDDKKSLKEGSEQVHILYPSGNYVKCVIKIDQFDLPVIKTKVKGSGCRFASAIWDGASNISGIFRNIFWLQNSTSPNPGITAGMGYTSAMGIVTGPITVIDSIKALHKAKKIGDVTGEKLAKVGIAKGVLETGSGAAMAGVRTLSLVALSTTAKSVAIANTAFGVASTVGFVAIFSIYAARFSRTLFHAIPLYMKLKNSVKTDEAFGVLTSKLSISYDELQACGNRVQAKSNYEKIKMTLENVKLTKSEDDILSPSDKKFVNAMINESEACFKKLRALVLKEIAKVKMGKEAEYQRIIGGTSLSILRNYQKQGVLTPQMMKEIVDVAKADLRKQVLRQTVLLFAVLLGVASFIVTTIFTGGAPLIIGFALMLVMNLILTASDTETMIKSMQALTKSSKKERIVLALLIILTIAITGVGAFFTGGGSLLAVALIMGALMVSVQACGMARASKIAKSSESKKVEIGSES